MLVSIRDYRERLFPPESRPTAATVRRWILNGVIPARAVRRLGKRYFIDLSKLDSGPVNSLVEKVLHAS